MLRLLLFCLLLASTLTTVSAQRSCASHDHLLEQLRDNPAMEQNLRKLENFTQGYSAEEKALSNGIITIPVVVHVVYRTSAENVSDAQINSQIDVLNDDFRRLNADRSNTPSDFIGVAADSEIEFCVVDVIRRQTSVNGFGTNDAMKFNNRGGSDVVNPNGAMNFWVCNIGGGILGYAQFPGGQASTDGVVVDYRYFGTTGTATAPFDLGRTATHEVGHYLNLRHIWGDGGCNVDDRVSDTPTAGGPNYTGGACTYPGPNSCRPRGRDGGDDLPDMFQNYMDYSDDGCMNLFTTGQKDRMWAAIEASRPGLLSSACDGTPPPPPPATEICDNGIDDDGDGQVDCADGDCASEAICDDGGGSACDAPTGLTHTRRKGGREAVLSWNAVSGADSYFVEVDGAGSTTTGGTSVTVTGLSKGTSYTWRVRSNCGSDQSAFAESSFTARLTGDEVAGLTITPNPTGAGMVRLAWDLGAAAPAAPRLTEQPSADKITVELLAIGGQRLLSRSVVNAEYLDVDAGFLPAGIYIVRISDDNGNVAVSRLARR